MSKYYYHGLGIPNIDSITNSILILQTGGIKCKRTLDKLDYGYNGLDYVSVCKKYPKEEYERYGRTGFYTYVQGCFCFIVSDRVEAIKTETIPKSYWYFKDVVDRMKHHPEIRYSDMFDEWQVRSEIPLSSIVGIGIPLKWLQRWDANILVLTELKKLIPLIEALGLDIVDSSKDGFVEAYEVEKEKGSSKVYQLSLEDILKGEVDE